MEKPEELAGGRASPQPVCCQLETQGFAVPYLQRSLGNGGVHPAVAEQGVITQKAALKMLVNNSSYAVALQNDWHVINLSSETTVSTLDATSCS